MNQEQWDTHYQAELERLQKLNARLHKRLHNARRSAAYWKRRAALWRERAERFRTAKR